jgi:outer membrane protein TolC
MYRSLAVLLFLAVPCSLRSQEKLLPLSELVRRVAQRDPGIRAREAERRAALVETSRVASERLPKLYVNTDVGAGKLINDVANVLLTGLTPVAVTEPSTRSRLADLSATRPYFLPGAHLEQELFDGGQTSAGIRSARLNESKAAVAQARSLEDEAYAAASDFLNLAYDRVLSNYLDEYSRIAQLAAQSLTDQAKAGRITDAQALAGQAKFQAARAAIDNDRDDLLTVSDLLRRRAGLDQDAAFDTRELETSLAQFNLAAIPQDPRFDKNAELQNSALDARIQQQGVRAARARLFPELKFVAEYGFTFSGEVFSFRPSYSLAMHATYPLFTGRELERNVRTQTLRLEAANLQQQKTGAALREEQIRLLAEGRKLVRESEAARGQLSQAEEVYRVARLKYDQGAALPSNLLEAAELLVSLRQRCLELARSSWLMRWSAIRFQGGLLAELEGGTQP